jgi:hypothetical protein
VATKYSADTVHGNVETEIIQGMSGRIVMFTKVGLARITVSLCYVTFMQIIYEG